MRASVTVRNTGSRPAREVVQAYVRDSVTSVSWADKELKGFTVVDVEQGAEATVELTIAVADCTIVDAEGRRVVEAGEFELLVGPSSRDEALLSARFTVSAGRAERTVETLTAAALTP
nr:hypothetical protein GCM10025699_36110 [Microbacterium flavescens]